LADVCTPRRDARSLAPRAEPVPRESSGLQRNGSERFRRCTRCRRSRAATLVAASSELGRAPQSTILAPSATALGHLSHRQREFLGQSTLRSHRFLCVKAKDRSKSGPQWDRRTTAACFVPRPNSGSLQRKASFARSSRRPSARCHLYGGRPGSAVAELGAHLGKTLSRMPHPSDLPLSSARRTWPGNPAPQVLTLRNP